MKIRAFFTKALDSPLDAEIFSHSVRAIANAVPIPSSELEPLFLQGISDMVDKALDDHALTADEEARVLGLRDALQISPKSLEESGLQNRLIKGAILQDIMQGAPKSRLNVSGQMPFILQKSETLLWLFQEVAFHEVRTRSQYVGRSSGVSFRVMKGVYIRTGGSKGERISTQSLERTDQGLMGITTKHIYFSGSAKSFRIPIKKLVSVEMYSGGVSVTKDGERATPQVFAVDDPWFAANLLSHLG